MSFQIIVTLGPSLLVGERLKQIKRPERCIFRINGAHLVEKEAASWIERVRNWYPDAIFLADLPGNKVRTRNFSVPLVFKKNHHFEILRHQTNFSDFYRYLKPQDRVWANDSTSEFEVVDADERRVLLLSHSDGVLLANKGLHARGIHDSIPFLFDKDLEMIQFAKNHSLDCLSLSYVRNQEDVFFVKKTLKQFEFTPKDLFIKIETASALQNLKSILEAGTIFNVDRGDLSSDIGLMNLPLAQEKIVTSALQLNKTIFLATHVLKNMEGNPIPSIAEVIDLANMIKRGVSGVQLSEETAVGMYPTEAINCVSDLVDQLLSE